MLAEVVRLPGGKTLTTLFNFQFRQQILIVDNGPPTVVRFDDVGDQNALEMMRQKLIDMGGKADSVVRLLKPRLTP